jgi:hypothetical protein
MPPGFEHVWGSLATAALVLFIIYRRFRRSFGRQAMRPRRMIARMVILGVVGLILLPAALRSSAGLLALSAGVALGLALGVWGAQHTRFERHGGELHYIPHTYAGMVVSALFLGRLLYRLLMLPQGMQTDANAFAGASPADAFGTIYHNPLTLGVFFVLIGYYVYYYSYVLWRFKHVKREDAAAAPTTLIE